MAADPNCFPVLETEDNKKIYFIGNVVKVPPATTCLLRIGRVHKVVMGKPGGTMLIYVEEVK